jgi:hypothetical protein
MLVFLNPAQIQVDCCEACFIMVRLNNFSRLLDHCKTIGYVAFCAGTLSALISSCQAKGGLMVAG